MGRCIRFCAPLVTVMLTVGMAQGAFAGNSGAVPGSVGFCQDNLQASSRGPSTVASPANDIGFSHTMFNTDFVSAGVGGLRNVGGGTIMLAGVTGPVSQALLYWNGPTNSSDSSVNASVMVNGVPFVGVNIGFSHDNCWGYSNSQAYMVDVTALVAVTGDGPYVLTGLGASAAIDGANSNGASLIVFFDDGNGANNRDVVIFHGNDSNSPNGFDANGWDVSLSGITYGGGTANLQLHVADGQDSLLNTSFRDSALVLNGSDLEPSGHIFSGNSVPSANSGPLGNGSLWDIRTWDVTSYLVPGPNTLTLTTGILSDCLGLIVAIVDLPAGAAPEDCDLNFEAPPNWPLFCDYYSINSQFMLGGSPYLIQPGDVIHATDPQGVVCGITNVPPDSEGTYLIHVLGDDPKTAEDEGAEFGDSITLWLNCDCPVTAPDTWVNFGNFEYDALWDCEGCDSICGWVYNCQCDPPGCEIGGATVEAWSSFPDGELLSWTTTDSLGHYCLPVEDSTEYDIRVWAKGYCTDDTSWQCEDGQLSICLDPIPFTPLPNWPYFTDFYSSDAMFMHDDIPYPIVPGDVIYATDPQGVICGVTWVQPDSFGAYLIHVLGDDPKTIEDEGAEFGDSITLWLNCECPAVAPDTWVNFGNFQFDALWDCEGGPLCCDLCKGWNMWSYNRVLPDYSREVVLQTIDLNYYAVRSGLCDYGSISWFSDRPVNDLEDVSPWYGYDIYMFEDDSICIEGELIDAQTPIYLCEGWNYIPYWPSDMDNLENALQSLSGNYSHIFTMYCDYGVASWNELRDPVNNDLVCMEICHGYWIRMKSEDTLIYPAATEGCNGAEPKLAARFTSNRVKATPMVADFYAPTSQLHSGDVIAVYGSSRQLIGEATVGANGAYLIHAYGDVPQTPDVEGAVQGEELRFEVNGLAASAGREVRWYDRDNSSIELTVGAATTVPTEYALLQNYPNPFNAGTVMPFVMKNTSEWTMTVYNIMGQTVRTFTGTDAAGTVRVAWNGQDQNGSAVPSGVYFYRVATKEWSATKKMTLLK